MKLLFNQNLSRHLCQRLEDLFPKSSHVVFLQLETAADQKIWNVAATNDCCVVTQDADFAEQSRLRGAPPKVVWMRCGNCTSAKIEAILRRNAELIQELSADENLSYVELF